MLNKKKFIAGTLGTLNILTTAMGTFANSSGKVIAETVLPHQEQQTQKAKSEESVTVKDIVRFGIKTVAKATLITLGINIAKRIYLLDVSTAVDKMTDAEVEKYRNEQTEKFKKLGNGMFEVDQNFISELPVRVAALIMGEINVIFEAYPNILKAFTGKLARLNSMGCNQKFRVGVFTPERDNVVAHANLFTVEFSKQYYNMSINATLLSGKLNMRLGSHSSGDLNKLIERNVAHEMGHVLENILLSTMPPKMDMKYCQKAHEKQCDVETIIKEEIINLARIKHNYSGNGYISRYGATNDSEWFAEVCAHCLCSEKPNALGLAFEDFMKQKNAEYEYANNQAS